MRASIRTRRAPLLLWGCAVLTVLMAGWLVAAPSAADPRLERAEAVRQERQAALDELLARIDQLEADIDDSESEMAALARAEQGYLSSAERYRERVAAHVRNSYKYGRVDPTWAFLVADDAADAAQQARLLAALALNSRSAVEETHASAVQVAATAEQIAGLAELREERHTELVEAKEEAQRLLAEAERAEEGVRATIAKEEAEERRRREARARADRAGSAVSRDIACPMARPHSFTDTYGAPRSGGRSHRGTDILAPKGTHIYAYEAGTISRMSTNRLGGIVLYLRGDSGNSYYYAHLQSYVGGLSPGQRVRAGQHIAYNGDTGNARGIPHLHIEVMRGGGGNVNPYPFMRRACG